MLACQTKENETKPAVSPEELQSMQQKYPNLLPIIIHPKDIDMTIYKYMIWPEISVEKFAQTVRKHCLNVDHQRPLFFSVNGILLPKDDCLGKIHHQYKKPDGFLHIILQQEPT